MVFGLLRSKSHAVLTISATLVALTFACTSDSVTGPGYVCDVTNPVSEVQFTTAASVLFVHSPPRATDTTIVAARTLNRAGTVRSDVPVSFESSDTTIATVDNKGVVRALKPGSVRIKASSCGTSAKTDITVTLAATSVQIKFDTAAIVAGDSVLAHASVLGQEGQIIPSAKFTFTFTGPQGATVTQRSDSTAIVKAPASSSGNVLVSASSEGVSGSASLKVVARVVEAKLDTITVVTGDSVLVTAKAHPQDSQTPIKDAAFTFTSSPSAGVTITQRSETSAIIKTSGTGAFVITATNLGVTGTTTLTALPRIFIGSMTTEANGVEAGRDFSCGVITMGRLYCWGLNDLFELGAKTDSLCFDEGPSDPPSALPCHLLPMRTAPDQIFTSVSAGDQFGCGLTSTARVYCWGTGSQGRLGNGRNAGAENPTPITSAASFASISVGGSHACALSTANIAWCWGLDSTGQLGDSRTVSSTTPIPVIYSGAPASFATISAGFRHTCAVDSSGGAFCWGLNNNGQVGVGGAGGWFDQPTPVAGGLAFKSITAGGDSVTISPTVIVYESHSCGITTGGAAYCWGSNASGQLGTGAAGSSVASPVAVAGGLTFAKISAGGRFTCGLTTGGDIYCWGRNHDLQLGNGNDVDTGTPQKVSGGDLPAGVTFVSVSAGRRHACGVASNGAAYCWGSNVFGALGNTLQAAFRGFPQRVATPQ